VRTFYFFYAEWLFKDNATRIVGNDGLIFKRLSFLVFF